VHPTPHHDSYPGAATRCNPAWHSRPARRTSGGTGRYQAATGRAADAAAISFYRLAWALADLAAFTGLLRAPHRCDSDTKKAWPGLLGTLHPGPVPGPYQHLASLCCKLIS
jgi:hypothetical protein